MTERYDDRQWLFDRIRFALDAHGVDREDATDEAIWEVVDMIRGEE